MREATEGSRYRPPINNGIKTALEFFEGGWSIKYNYSINYSDKFPLDPTRFQVSFEGMLSEEKIRDLMTHEWQVWGENGTTDFSTGARMAIEQIADELNSLRSKEEEA